MQQQTAIPQNDWGNILFPSLNITHTHTHKPIELFSLQSQLNPNFKSLNRFNTREKDHAYHQHIHMMTNTRAWCRKRDLSDLLISRRFRANLWGLSNKAGLSEQAHKNSSTVQTNRPRQSSKQRAKFCSHFHAADSGSTCFSETHRRRGGREAGGGRLPVVPPCHWRAVGVLVSEPGKARIRSLTAAASLPPQAASHPGGQRETIQL